jgi:tripartite-type tricarboxylate transporter receptor subunit TctC
VLPEIPTIAEAGGPGYEFIGGIAVLAPPEQPRPVVTRLHRDPIPDSALTGRQKPVCGQRSRACRQRSQGIRNYLRSEIARWTKVIEAAGIRAD